VVDWGCSGGCGLACGGVFVGGVCFGWWVKYLGVFLGRGEGSVHYDFSALCTPRCGERAKGACRRPLCNPRGPATKSVLRTALTSRPAACGRLNSTSCLDSPLAAIPGVQPLSSGLRFADFSGGQHRSHIQATERLEGAGPAENRRSVSCRPGRGA